jgi:hypothetical protein
MTSAAGVVVVQACDGVEPEQASQIGKFNIQVAPEALSQRGLNTATEVILAEDGRKARVELRAFGNRLLPNEGR